MADDNRETEYELVKNLKLSNFMSLEYGIILHSHVLRTVIERNTDTRCIAIYFAIWVFHIAIYRNSLLAYRCTPTIYGIDAIAM